MDWQQRPRCDETAVWPKLAAHFRQCFAGPRAFDLRQAFAQDTRRFERFSLEAPPLLADLSKQLLDEPAQQLLTELARECRVEVHRDAMLAGERINTSERRAVTHVHWRWVSDQGLAPVEQAPAAIKNVASVIPEAAAVQADMLAFAEAVRANPGITDVVNIGIGGSDLGPRLAVQALRAAGQTSGPRLHFVANMDGHELAQVLARLSADRTLFIIVSKTFGTAETLRNAQSARDWFLAQGGADVARHFVAVSANAAAARAFGAGRCFGFDEGVGGRFSLWSPVGLAIAIAIGRAGFQALLAGARALDRHFAEAPLARNLPVQLALLDLWCRNFLGLASRCVAPYHHGLRQLPAYLQQLEMESNGKCVDLDGEPLPFGTSPVVWGEPGTNGQHAYFQMLHQGTDVIPVEFIAVKHPTHPHADLHAKALANCLAQSQALMLGKTTSAALGERAPTASASLGRLTVARHRTFPGNRPSTTLLLDQLTPRSLGALIAMYEHRVFTSGALWGINSFDQWGVELGKALASQLLPRLTSACYADVSGLDGSTAGLVARLKG